MLETRVYRMSDGADVTEWYDAATIEEVRAYAGSLRLVTRDRERGINLEEQVDPHQV